MLPVPTAARLSVVLSVLLVFLSPLLYVRMYAGDAAIHLVYGENAAHGRFFEFNPGEKSPGVTAPGYMLLLALFFRVFPDTWVPAVVKGFNILCWYALIGLVFLLASRVFGREPWAWATAVVAGLLPGSVYNSTIGMESGIFALLVVLWIYLADCLGWFAPASSSTTAAGAGSELALGALLGLTCWLRPEGFVIAAIALAYRAIFAARLRICWRSAAVRSGLFAMSFMVVAGAVVAFHVYQTGYVLPASGLSRILLGRSDSLHIGPLLFNSHVPTRLLAYFPLTGLWLVANWLILTDRIEPRDSRAVVEFLLLVCGTFFILYSTVLGSAHLARYLVFVMPAFVLLACLGARWFWEHSAVAGRRRSCAVVGFGLALILAGIFTAESVQRLHLGSQTALAGAMHAPRERAAFSDWLFRELGQPTVRPISIALQEVQIRYWLDGRFIVRSLDGRVDPVLLKYVQLGQVDHIGYLTERQANFLLATPNYNRDRDLWSLQRLATLDPGYAVSYRGLTFTRLPSKGTVIRVARTVDSPAHAPAGSETGPLDPAITVRPEQLFELR
jgi:hypothetical protein